MKEYIVPIYDDSQDYDEIFVGQIRNDAVEVVRCKDCKYFVIAQLKSDYTEDKRYNPSVCINGRYAVPRKPDWFCASGERRDE